jgi:hypothetical protein
MGVAAKQTSHCRRWRRVGVGWLGKSLQDKAESESSQFHKVPAQESSLLQRVLHFNSDGKKLQEDCEWARAAWNSS